MSENDPSKAVMMQVPFVGPFIRASLPVRLEAGYKLTFGVWMAVSPDDLQHASRVWWESEYKDLVLEGWLANALPGWGLLSSPITARVRDADQAPFVTDSPDLDLARLLTQEWPHTVLDGLP